MSFAFFTNSATRPLWYSGLILFWYFWNIWFLSVAPVGSYRRRRSIQRRSKRFLAILKRIRFYFAYTGSNVAMCTFYVTLTHLKRGKGYLFQCNYGVGVSFWDIWVQVNHVSKLSSAVVYGHFLTLISISHLRSNHDQLSWLVSTSVAKIPK